MPPYAFQALGTNVSSSSTTLGSAADGAHTYTVTLSGSKLYELTYHAVYQSDTSTNGMKVALSGTRAPDLFCSLVNIGQGTTTGQRGVTRAYDANVTSAGVPAINSDVFTYLNGVIKTGGGGTTDLHFRYANEVGGVVTVKSGSSVIAEEVNDGDGRCKVLWADVSSSSQTLGNLTEIPVTVPANSAVYFRYYAVYQSSATTNGIKLTVSGTFPPTTLAAKVSTGINLGATTGIFDDSVWYWDHHTGSVSVSQVDSNFLAIVEGLVWAGATGGDMYLRYANEEASRTVKIMSGSFVTFDTVVAAPAAEGGSLIDPWGWNGIFGI